MQRKSKDWPMFRKKQNQTIKNYPERNTIQLFWVHRKTALNYHKELQAAWTTMTQEYRITSKAEKCFFFSDLEKILKLKSMVTKT